MSIEEELTKLEAKAKEALEETYSELTPWQKTQVARHPERPHFRNYIDGLVQDFTPLAGDRSLRRGPGDRRRGSRTAQGPLGGDHRA